MAACLCFLPLPSMESGCRTGSFRDLSVHSSERGSSPTLSIRQQRTTFSCLLDQQSEPQDPWRVLGARWAQRAAVYESPDPSNRGTAEVTADRSISIEGRSFSPSSCQMDLALDSHLDRPTTSGSCKSAHWQQNALMHSRSFMLRERLCMLRSRSFVLREGSGSSRRASSLRGSFSHSYKVSLVGKRGLSGSFGLNEERLRKAQMGGQDPHPITTVDRSNCAQVGTHVETQVGIAVRTNSQPVVTECPATHQTAPADKRNRSLTKADLFFMEEIEKVEKAAEAKRLASHSFSPARKLRQLSITNVEPLSPSPDVQEMSGSSRWLMFTDAAHVNLRRSTL